MCSILFSNKPVSADKYNLLKLRGPDATTSRSIAGYNFVHNLLSLTGEYTEQPICKDDIVLLFNGEIYNYKDLDISAKSDSYSIISAYKKYGPEFVKQLDGEYAFVLVDIKQQLILFSTDVFKTKPLFYSIEHGYIGISTFSTPLQTLGFDTIIRAKPNTCYKIDLISNSINEIIIKEFDLNQYKTSYDDWIAAFELSIKKRAYQSGDMKTFIGLSSGYDSGAIAVSYTHLTLPTILRV